MYVVGFSCFTVARVSRMSKVVKHAVTGEFLYSVAEHVTTWGIDASKALTIDSDDTFVMSDRMIQEAYWHNEQVCLGYDGQTPLE